MIIIDIASLFKQYNATNYSMQIKQLCRGPYLARPRATAPSAPPLIRHWFQLVKIILIQLVKSCRLLFTNTSTLRLLGRFTTCIAQTTTALRLFFALNGTSCLRNEIFLEIFDFKTFFKYCTITMTY